MPSTVQRDLVQAALLFVASVLVFMVLGQIVGWPNPTDGWSLAILVSAVVALLPIAPRILAAVGKNLTSFEAFGVKMNFATAVSGSKVVASTDVLVQQAVPTPEPGSGIDEMEHAAKEASETTVFIIDLKEGREWYWTRLFALAGMATLTGSPKLIVLIGQRGRRTRQVAGSLRPPDVITALAQMDGRYATAWETAKRELRMARSGNSPHAHYNQFYAEIGDAVIMRILVEYMRYPGQFPGADPSALEPDPPTPALWMTLGEAERQLDPWLVRRTVELGEDDKAKLEAILSSDEEIVVATRDSEYDGVIDVRRVERHVLRQLMSDR